MVKLLLPLKFYDEGGRVLPPRALWWCLLFVAKSFIIFLFSLTLPEQSERLLKMFYPIKEELYTGLMLGCFALPPALLVSFRHKVWEHHKEILFILLKPFILLGLIGEFAFTVTLVDRQFWGFSWGLALSLLVNLVAIYWLFTSKHLKIMLADWRHRVEH